MSLNSTDIVEAGGLAGFDFVILDCEHGYMSPETTMDLVRAAQVGGTTPITRVTFNGETEILRALDVGAYGVQVPQINTREDAELAVCRAKYYPMGIPGQIDDPRIQEAAEIVLSACKKYGKIPGIYAEFPQVAKMRAQQGFRYIPIGMVTSLISRAFVDVLNKARN